MSYAPFFDLSRAWRVLLDLCDATHRRLCVFEDRYRGKEKPWSRPPERPFDECPWNLALPTHDELETCHWYELAHAYRCESYALHERYWQLYYAYLGLGLFSWQKRGCAAI